MQESFVTRLLSSLPVDPEAAAGAEEVYKGVTALAYIGTWGYNVTGHTHALTTRLSIASADTVRPPLHCDGRKTNL